MHASRFILCMVMVASQFACAHAIETDASQNPRQCEPEVFLKMSYAQRKNILPTCTPDQQVTLYISRASATIPPNMDHLEDIARQGKEVVPALVERLEQRDPPAEELHKPDLLAILELINRREYFCVSCDYELMTRIESAVRAIRNDYIRDWAQSILQDLKKTSYEMPASGS